MNAGATATTPWISGGHCGTCSTRSASRRRASTITSRRRCRICSCRNVLGRLMITIGEEPVQGVLRSLPAPQGSDAPASRESSTSRVVPWPGPTIQKPISCLAFLVRQNQRRPVLGVFVHALERLGSVASCGWFLPHALLRTRGGRVLFEFHRATAILRFNLRIDGLFKPKPRYTTRV